MRALSGIPWSFVVRRYSVLAALNLPARLAELLRLLGHTDLDHFLLG